jgi:hypothetical protein
MSKDEKDIMKMILSEGSEGFNEVKGGKIKPIDFVKKMPENQTSR